MDDCQLKFYIYIFYVLKKQLKITLYLSIMLLIVASFWIASTDKKSFKFDDGKPKYLHSKLISVETVNFPIHNNNDKNVNEMTRISMLSSS